MSVPNIQLHVLTQAYCKRRHEHHQIQDDDGDDDDDDDDDELDDPQVSMKEACATGACKKLSEILSSM